MGKENNLTLFVTVVCYALALSLSLSFLINTALRKTFLFPCHFPAFQVKKQRSKMLQQKVPSNPFTNSLRRQSYKIILILNEYIFSFIPS